MRDNAAACECLPGFSVSAESGVCVQCPAGFYCVGGADKKEECPHAANSDPGAGSTDMCLCPEGYFGTGSVGCTRCPAGQKCAGDGEAEACPLGTTSNAGANSCQCAKGFFGEGIPTP
ncbi:hypothetical protein T484DRAFT_1841191 [Baffinella frigidus]|nr:hypothetical protein T484DRAFT_1841191 [Cryptophyta sp. CCMP2293]